MTETLNGGGQTCDTGRSLRVCSGGAVSDKQAAGKRPLWNVADVATYFRISERTVRDWIFKRRIPYRKVGRCVRFEPEVIERWALPEQE